VAVAGYVGLQLGRLGIPPHVAYGLCLLQEPLGLTQGLLGARTDARDLVSPIGCFDWLGSVGLYLKVQVICFILRELTLDVGKGPFQPPAIVHFLPQVLWSEAVFLLCRVRDGLMAFL
jgi:hypothetical protein